MKTISALGLATAAILALGPLAMPAPVAALSASTGRPGPGAGASR
jgi:hypothetical protein